MNAVNIKNRLFFDTILNKVDAKLRVSVPSEYRDILAGHDSDLIAWPSFVLPCIECCASEFMEMLMGRINSRYDILSEDHDDLTSLILARSKRFAYDATGRIVLTQRLTEHAKITDSALFVGLGDKFQIWSPHLYEAEENRRLLKIKEKKFQLGAGG